MNSASVWLIIVAATGLVGWYLVHSFWKGRPLTIGAFFFRSVLKLLFKLPETLTAFGILEKLGIRGHNRRWAGADMAFQRTLVTDMESELAILKTYKNARKDPAKALSAEILEWFLADQVEGGKYLPQGFPVTQMFGYHTQLPDLLQTMQPVGCRADAVNFAIRVETIPAQIDQVISFMEDSAKAGCVPPRFALTKAAAQMRTIIAPEPRDNPVYTAFAEKLGKLHLSRDAKAALKARVETAVRESMYPAYRKLAEYCDALLTKADSDSGVWRLPDGAEYYRYRLRSSTTVETDPPSVHKTGLEEVARIETEMHAILDALGIRPAKTIGERVIALSKDERFYYPGNEEGRTAILADFNAIIAGMEARLPEVFERLPKARVEVLAVPAAQEKDSPSGYYQPGTMDGKRPGRFFVNLYDMKKNPKYSMKTLCYHEAIPGHHLQLTLAMEMKGVPMFRRFLPFTAYMEGWALYSERLAREMGFYAGDKPGELGYLLSEHFRAVRLVVDTGLHAMKWSREDAMAYMLEHTGDENVAEVERYIVMSGQACAYKVGELTIRALRAEAEKELGPRFDLRAFHTVLLDGGAMPLDTLSRIVREWIKARKAV